MNEEYVVVAIPKGSTLVPPDVYGPFSQQAALTASESLAKMMPSFRLHIRPLIKPEG